MENRQFGLSVIPERNPEQTINLCVLAERLGFNFIWMADEGPEFYDPFVLLSQVASKTTRIKLATGITNPYMRHPSLIASAIMSLDAVSHGCAVLGIGRRCLRHYLSLAYVCGISQSRHSRQP